MIAELLSLADAYEKALPDVAPFELPSADQFAKLIDHTLLKPDAVPAQIIKLCLEAQDYGFASVCINPTHIPLAVRSLSGSTIPVCTVIGFPLGADLPSHKVFEALACLEAGAKELDMVLNVGALKSENYGLVLNEIQTIAQLAHQQDSLLKVIIETALLSRREKILACILAKDAGADFVKTSTGFAASGATVEDVQLMRQVVGLGMGVKASGGVRSYEDAAAMVQAGASRIGTSSGVTIIQQAQK
jgi:deoxyribose-phosphate aldolase